MKEFNILVYGANGYTGRLVLEELRKKGLRCTIAGRNEKQIKELAEKYQLDHRVFSLDNANEIEKNIAEFKAVLHCAGPFIKTSQPMARACINTGCHYLDITGEIPVYEGLQKLDDEARRNKVMLLPGVGFDIVPTDCMAAMLKKQMPDATHLELAFVGLGSASAGTTKSALAQMPHGSLQRMNSEMKKIAMFSLSREIEINHQTYPVYTIPWGDVFTAYYSTGIPNIVVYTHFSKSVASMAGLTKPFLSLLKSDSVLKAAQGLVGMLVDGPDENTRETGKAYIWGEVRNASKTLQGRMVTREGYKLTSLSSIAACEKIIEGKVKPGFQTPSQVFSENFVLEIDGTEKPEFLET